MAAGLQIGLGDVLAVNTGNYNVPVWTVVDLAQDANLNLEISKVEVKSRGNTTAMTIPAFLSGPLDAVLLADTSHAAYNTLRTAFANRTINDLAFADGAIATNGTEYFRADFYCYKFSKKQPLEGPNTIEAEYDFAYSANPQAFVTVGS